MIVNLPKGQNIKSEYKVRKINLDNILSIMLSQINFTNLFMKLFLNRGK